MRTSSGIKRNRAGDIAMLQRLYTTGRIPLNHKLKTQGNKRNQGPIFCSKDQQGAGSTGGVGIAHPMGIDAGDVLVRSNNPECSGLSLDASTDSYVFSSLSSCHAVKPEALWDDKKKVTTEAAIRFMGISETSIATSNIGKSDTSVTSIVNGSVTIVGDESIKAGDFVCITYPWDNVNTKLCNKEELHTSGGEQSEGTVPSKMKVVAYNKYTGVDVEEEDCCIIPIGQCVRGSTDAHDLIQVRLFTGLY